MSALDELAKAYGSRRYARDLLEGEGQVMTRPWWPVYGSSAERQRAERRRTERARQKRTNSHTYSGME